MSKHPQDKNSVLHRDSPSNSARVEHPAYAGRNRPATSGPPVVRASQQDLQRPSFCLHAAARSSPESLVADAPPEKATAKSAARGKPPKSGISVAHRPEAPPANPWTPH